MGWCLIKCRGKPLIFCITGWTRRLRSEEWRGPNTFRRHHSIKWLRNRGGGAVGYNVRPTSRRLGIRIPIATDLNRKNRQWQLHCWTLSNRRECHGSSEMTIINGCPVSKCLWHAKEPSLLNGHECQNLQPFTGNGDVSIWVKNSRVEREPPNKLTNKLLRYCQYWLIT